MMVEPTPFKPFTAFRTRGNACWRRSWLRHPSRIPLDRPAPPQKWALMHVRRLPLIRIDPILRP